MSHLGLPLAGDKGKERERELGEGDFVKQGFSQDGLYWSCHFFPLAVQGATMSL